MVYPANFEGKIGFDRIREQVSALCTTAAARRKLSGEGFSDDRDAVARRIALCDELRQATMMEGDAPRVEYVDTEALLDKAAVVGSWLTLEEVATLRRALTAVHELSRFFASRKQYPTLYSLSQDVASFPQIAGHVDTLLDRHDNLKDNASPELYDIRRAIRESEGRVAKRLQQILAAAQAAGLVEGDAAISMRDGRATIPVPAANKRKVRGFVLDESATGKTCFIEPVEVVEINNELRELEHRQKREVVRILTRFTDAIRPDVDGLRASGDYLTTLDMLAAKARWASDNGCVRPIVSDDFTLCLRSARHPLLAQTLAREGRQIVPLDVRLDRSKRILVISGPNAGGKSVCLKTIGLLQYMFQCGFPLPALENSEMPLFDSLLIDIGDEQSIDNDLSTYSSHLLNMKNMLAGATDRSLLLIDEFGAGTEPTIGGAIAEAILERFAARGAFGVITTHYSNIKYFASSAEGVENGAMTFDTTAIRPLFRLEMGTPGSSFAIEIARKSGLGEDIIRLASEKAGDDRVNLERQLREIARDRRYWEQKRDRIRIADRNIEQIENKYEQQLTAIRSERNAIIRAAREEASRLLSEANKQIENTIRTIREAQADRELTRLARRELEEFREKAAEANERQGDMVREQMERIEARRRRRAERQGLPAAEAAEPEAVKREPEVGGKVRIVGQEGYGEVVSIKGKRATVAFGHILTTVDRQRLEAVSNAEYKRFSRASRPAAVVSVDISQRKLNFKHNIDLRGMRAAEALEWVEDFIDDAIMTGASEVRILHGKGTGALKEEVRRYLSTVREVASATDEHVDMGGAGITVVKLR
ncbi:MAG: Smr/MutS family protein [Rikenellaceae bacterium]|jgi:DNA mismatch repair protein MutS2|nr:Smr/MutS family protein [Rikenellaceae bacterium]